MVASSIYNFVRSLGNRKCLKTLFQSTFPKAHFGKGSPWKALFLAMSDVNHVPLQNAYCYFRTKIMQFCRKYPGCWWIPTWAFASLMKPKIVVNIFKSCMNGWNVLSFSCKQVAHSKIQWWIVRIFCEQWAYFDPGLHNIRPARAFSIAEKVANMRFG